MVWSHHGVLITGVHNVFIRRETDYDVYTVRMPRYSIPWYTLLNSRWYAHNPEPLMSYDTRLEAQDCMYSLAGRP